MPDVTSGVKTATLSAIVTHADGTVEDLGVIALLVNDEQVFPEPPDDTPDED